MQARDVFRAPCRGASDRSVGPRPPRESWKKSRKQKWCCFGRVGRPRGRRGPHAEGRRFWIVDRGRDRLLQRLRGGKGLKTPTFYVPGKRGAPFCRPPARHGPPVP